MNKKKALTSAAKSLLNNFPVLFGVILLVGLFNSVVPKSFYQHVFKGSLLIDPWIGSTIGSVLAGNPVTSYVIGGELLSQGVSLVAVLSFIVAWVTVGIVQLPAESIMLGKKFALTRNFISFILSVIVAVVTVLLMWLI